MIADLQFLKLEVLPLQSSDIINHLSFHRALRPAYCALKSLIMQRFHRLHSRGSPGGEETRRHRHNHQQ